MITVVGSEEDADILFELEFSATVFPEDANEWDKDGTSVFRGKQVVLAFPGNKKGKKQMAEAAKAINGDYTVLKALPLPITNHSGTLSSFIGDLAFKEDAVERLSLMFESAVPYVNKEKPKLEDAVLGVQQFMEIVIPEKKPFLFPWLKQDSINLIAGWRGCGKTWFVLGILDAVSDGGKFGPWACEKAAPCLFLDGEMTMQDNQERIKDLNLYRQRKCELAIYCDAFANFLGLPRANLTDEKWREQMKAMLIQKGIKLFVVDNLASLASGLDENAKQDWDPINQWFLELRFAGISTIMLHHVNKDGKQRGTSAREDNVDISILLRPPHDYTTEDGARFIAEFNKKRISTKYLGMIADTEFKLSLDESGEYVWTYSDVKRGREVEVLRMLGEGTKQIDVAETLGINRGQVSKIRSRAIKEGHLTQQNKLTQSGLSHVFGR
jgi:putative DNA primase/helicase